MNTFDIALDLDKGVTRQPQVVRIRQADHDGTTINAVVYDHGERIDAYRFEHAFFCMRLPDGSHYYRKECSIQSFGQQSWVNAIVDEREAASATGRTYNAYFAFELVGRYYSTGHLRQRAGGGRTEGHHNGPALYGACFPASPSNRAGTRCFGTAQAEPAHGRGRAQAQ